MASCRAILIALSIVVCSFTLPSSAGSQSSGVLAANEAWTSRDYISVLFAVQNGQITLPRRDNPRTAAFFAKLIDRSNIEQLMATSMATMGKRDQILIILGTTGELRSRYGYSVSLGDDVENELVEIQEFRLYLMGRLARLDAEDGWTGCPQGQRCDNAVATALAGTLDTLANHRVFTIKQRVALSHALTEHYPAIRMKLTKAEHQEITSRLAGIEANESDGELKGALEAALQAARRGN